MIKDLSTLSAQIKATRKKKGFTQKALAERLGIDRTHISRAENDILNVSVSKLRKIVETGLGGEVKFEIKLLS